MQTNQLRICNYPAKTYASKLSLLYSRLNEIGSYIYTHICLFRGQ